MSRTSATTLTSAAPAQAASPNDPLDALDAVVREEVRRCGVDPLLDVASVRRFAASAVHAHDQRSLSGQVRPLLDPGLAVDEIVARVAGFGPLQPYLDDPRVEEIWINQPQRVFVARDGQHELTTTVLTTSEVRDLVERMLKTSGRRLDLSSPFVDAMLPSGHRLHVALDGISRGFSAVNIRKFVVRASRLAELVDLGTIPPAAAAFLEACVVAGLNIVVSGGTQAGKTTLLNCLGSAVPGRERIVSVEEVYELRFDHPDWVAMQTRQAGLEGTGEITLRRLVKEALRMRPSRIVVGEVRSEECLDLLLALNSGLPGMATVHANSAREALVKLCTLPLLAGENISGRFVVPTVAACVDIVVQLGLDSGGRRRVREIVGVPGRVEADVIETDAIYTDSKREVDPGSRDATAVGEVRSERHRRGRVVVGRLPERSRLGALMGTAIGLVLGVGLLLIWNAVSGPDRIPRARTPGLMQRLQHLLRSAGIEGVSAAGLASLCVVAALVVGIAVLLVSRTPPVAAAFAAFAAYGPVALVRSRARRRRRELAEVWPEAVDNLASAIRAGLSLAESLSQLGDRGPESLRPAFAAFARDYTASGRFGDCLDRLKANLADPVGDRVVEALRIARDVGGGDLGRMLRSLSRFLRDDARTRSEVESRQAWVVNGARLAAAAPWVVLLVLSLQPEVIGRYGSPTGVLVLAVGGVTCLLAYRLMVRVGRLPPERRVLQ